MRGIQFSTAAAAAFVMQASPAWADLDAEALRQYGGNWSVACGNAAAPNLRVLQAELMVEARGKRMTGRQVQAAYSYFGQSPPPNYQVALLSEVKGGASLLFVVLRDARGQYIELSGDKPVEAALGAVLGPTLRAKFRDCNAAGRAAPGLAAADMPATTAAQNAATGDAASSSGGTAGAATSPTDLLRDARFKSAYLAALGPLAREVWLRRLDGPASPNRQVQVAGGNYTLAATCKPHDCGDNNMVLLYAPASGVIYGKVLQQGTRSTYFGAPSPPVAAALERLWRAEWRQGQ